MAGAMAPVFERIYIHNYKCLVEFDLRLQNTVLLLGGNGVGKTSVPDVIFALRELLAGAVKRSKDAIANLQNEIANRFGYRRIKSWIGHRFNRLSNP